MIIKEFMYDCKVLWRDLRRRGLKITLDEVIQLELKLRARPANQ
jgi:hypothetical protein